MSATEHLHSVVIVEFAEKLSNQIAEIHRQADPNSTSFYKQADYFDVNAILSPHLVSLDKLQVKNKLFLLVCFKEASEVFLSGSA